MVVLVGVYGSVVNLYLDSLLNFVPTQPMALASGRST